MTFEVVKLKIQNFYYRKTAKIRRLKLKETNFTIISNNCWAGRVYESYGIKKNSPTIGMYFLPEEYLKFISNLEYYLKNCKLTFIPPEQSRHRDFYKKDKTYGKYLIGKLGDVEIAMLHYHNEKEALEKWIRRCERVNWNRILVKMNDQNGCSENDFNSFVNDRGNYKKIFFSIHKEWRGNWDNVYIFNGSGAEINTSAEPIGNNLKLNINNLLNLV